MLSACDLCYTSDGSTWSSILSEMAFLLAVSFSVTVPETSSLLHSVYLAL